GAGPVRRFTADAAHALAAPLASIRGHAELARRVPGPLPPDVAYALGRVEAESARLAAAVEDLLLLARLDGGDRGRPGPVDLARLVVEAVGGARAAGPEHRWVLELPDRPVRVTGDADRLRQVVANLLGNARTHTPAGSTVTVTLAGAGGPGDGTVRLTVADDGPGIPADLLPRVFERFARGERARSRAPGGTGLGLAIVSAVVRAHGGTVRADSSPAGTAFRIRLPGTPVPVGVGPEG
ncbi:MAG: Two-component system sensor histidine kinase, partial [uncultured Corynebacteriales bacterium]